MIILDWLRMFLDWLDPTPEVVLTSWFALSGWILLLLKDFLAGRKLGEIRAVDGSGKLKVLRSRKTGPPQARLRMAFLGSEALMNADEAERFAQLLDRAAALLET